MWSYNMESGNDFNGVWTLDVAIPVRRSNQLSYEATDVGSWSFVGPKEPVRNECEVIIWNISYIELQMWNQVSYYTCTYESNFCNSLYRGLKKSGLQWGLNRDIAIRLPRSKQLSYEATDVGSWSFVGPRVPVRNECWTYNMKYFIYWTVDVKSSKLWPSQLWKQFMELCI